MESMVGFQQGLQQAYCSRAIKEGKLGIVEPNALAYAAGASFMQEKGFKIGFHDTTRITRDRVAPTDVQQLYVQMHSAICNQGLSFDSLGDLKNPKKIFEFIKATFAAGVQDSKQHVYQSDYILHSVSPVSMEVAAANLQPIPGSIEYATGCNACFYRKHVVPGTGEVIHCRYNLSLSEDQRQIMTGRTLDNQITVDDCETHASAFMSVAKAMNELRESILKQGHTAIKLDARLWSGHSQDEQVKFAMGVANVFKRVAAPLKVFFTTGNAYAPAAGMASPTVCGHAYAQVQGSILDEEFCEHVHTGLSADGQNYYKVPRSSVVKMTTSLEGTKWLQVLLSNCNLEYF